MEDMKEASCACYTCIDQSGDLHCANLAIDRPGVDGDKLSCLDGDFILGQNCVNKNILLL